MKQTSLFLLALFLFATLANTAPLKQDDDPFADDWEDDWNDDQDDQQGDDQTTDDSQPEDNQDSQTPAEKD